MKLNRKKCPTCKYNEGEHIIKPCGRCLISIDNCYYFPNDEILALHTEWKRKYSLLTIKCPWCEGKGKLTKDGKTYSEIE
jgi:hypothetical protein